MRRSILLAFFSISVFFSCDNVGTTSEVHKETESQNESEGSFDKNITTKQLISLLENIDDQEYISSKLDSFDFREKFNGVYISNELVDVNEPKHWIHITEAGASSSISLSTADEESWKMLLKELEDVSKPEPFDDETSAKALRYIGKDYTYESYEPENGINLSPNALYRVYIMKTTKEKR